MFRLRHSLLALVLTLSLPAIAQEVIQIDAHAPTTPFPHFWEGIAVKLPGRTSVNFCFSEEIEVTGGARPHINDPSGMDHFIVRIPQRNAR